MEQCQAKKSDQCQVTISHRYKRIFGSEPNSQEKDQGIWPDLLGKREKKQSLNSTLRASGYNNFY